MKDTLETINNYLNWLNGTITDQEYLSTFKDSNGIHGKCKAVINEAYGIRYIYDDGTEEYYNLGE